MTSLNPPATILVVEDNPDDFTIFEFALRGAQIQNPVVHVEDGAAALDYMFARGKYSDRATYPIPGILFLDINLPKVNGIKVLETLRGTREFSSIPVVMVTVSDSSQDVLRSYESGSSLFVQKPVVPENLIALSGAITILQAASTVQER